MYYRFPHPCSYQGIIACNLMVVVTISSLQLCYGLLSLLCPLIQLYYIYANSHQTRAYLPLCKIHMDVPHNQTSPAVLLHRTCTQAYPRMPLPVRSDYKNEFVDQQIKKNCVKRSPLLDQCFMWKYFKYAATVTSHSWSFKRWKPSLLSHAGLIN